MEPTAQRGGGHRGEVMKVKRCVMNAVNPRKKYHVIIAAVLIQLCVGVGNLWSIFQEGIAQSIFAGDHSGAGLCFSLLIAMLGVGGIIGGKLEQRFSVRVTIVVGSILLAAGFLTTGFVTAEIPWLIWLTYGILGGLGCGFCYSPSISCAQKWFPKKKGFVTGVIVAALGSSGIIFTPILELLINKYGGVGVGEQGTFITLSVIFFVVCTLSGLVMVAPKEGEVEKVELKVNASPVKSYTSKEMLKNPKFYLIALTFMLGCMGGLMILGFAKPIAVAKGLTEIAAVGVLLIAIFNAIGRLIWGIVSDKIGRINTIIVLLIGSAIFSFLVPLAQGYLIFAVIAGIGFFYGGLLTSFPALTADTFGPKYMATNYGIVLMGFGISAIVSSQIAGYYKNLASENIDLMAPAFMIASVAALVGTILLIILNRLNKKMGE